MKILVLNAGSSSLKYQLFDMENASVLAKGACERIGAGGTVVHKKTGAEPFREERELSDHSVALQRILALLTSSEYGVIHSVEEIDAVGHRVVHGGEQMKESTLLTESVLRHLEAMVPLNPLHGPPAIAGIQACIRQMPNVPQVGVFDTSFYSEMEAFRYVYPLPYEFYEEDGIRRYGFHGTSHRYVSAELAKNVGKPLEDMKVITCHLGNGSSVTAIEGGKAIDTSMGFTPQDGIVMGTRSGSIDPTIVTYLMKTKGYTAQETEEILNKRSGLLGISGISNDCRNVSAAAQEGNPRAVLAIQMLVNSIKKQIGAYVAEMNGLDALVFTAGLGENQPNIRRLVCEKMGALGIEIDESKNRDCPRGIAFEITKSGAKVSTWVIPTDEEYMIAVDTQRLVTQQN